jgi:hypothetical protein
VPPLSHLTSSTTTKSNIYPAIPWQLLQVTLASAGSSRSMCQISCPLSTAYVIAKNQSKSEKFVNDLSHGKFSQSGVVTTSPNPQAGGLPRRLSATAYSIYSHLPSILEAIPPSATWGCTMPWWQGPTYHRHTGKQYSKLTGTPLIWFLPNIVSSTMKIVCINLNWLLTNKINVYYTMLHTSVTESRLKCTITMTMQCTAMCHTHGDRNGNVLSHSAAIKLHMQYWQILDKNFKQYLIVCSSSVKNVWELKVVISITYSNMQ